jgi:hypothetical protein
MGSYLQTYGAGEERRNQIVKRVVLTLLTIVVLAIIAYFLLKDRSEKTKVKEFLAELNAGNYQKAYETWGCTAAHPCRDYDFQKFMEDWGPKNTVTPPWQVASEDSCREFLTANLQAKGSDLQSIMVERGDQHIMGFAPAPECQERKWRFGQFFRRILHGSS